MVKMYLIELKFSRKTSEEKFAASLGTKAKPIFLNICDYFKKICQKHRDSISHIERTVNVLGESPTKITITNASIDKQITLKREYIYKIEITDLEIGFWAFYYVYYSILKHVDVPDRLAQCMRYASTF